MEPGCFFPTIQSQKVFCLFVCLVLIQLTFILLSIHLAHGTLLSSKIFVCCQMVVLQRFWEWFPIGWISIVHLYKKLFRSLTINHGYMKPLNHLDTKIQWMYFGTKGANQYQNNSQGSCEDAGRNLSLYPQWKVLHGLNLKDHHYIITNFSIRNTPEKSGLFATAHGDTHHTVKAKTVETIPVVNHGVSSILLWGSYSRRGWFTWLK